MMDKFFTKNHIEIDKSEAILLKQTSAEAL